jgi:MFS family permease
MLLLITFSAGALLVGVELLITAVALPRIVVDLADWTQLRRASWIINGYAVSFIAVMPLAGRAADRFGLPRLFMLSLGTFAVGSLLSGAAQTLDQLIAARVVQGLGAGAIVPLATAGASFLYDGPARSRALGVVGACTFLGMALGPVFGAAILGWFDVGPAVTSAGAAGSAAADFLTPSWRWIFYLGAPIALLMLLYTWAAAPGWKLERPKGRIDVVGAVLFTTFIASGLLSLTLIGTDSTDPVAGPLPWAALCLVTGGLAVMRFLRVEDPFLDLRLFRNRVFSAAVVVSLLTGYALATAIIGGAVFVDRVRYAGPDEQRLVLGGLAGAMAVGALVSGFAVRLFGVVALSLVGLLLSIGGLLLAASVRPESALMTLVGGLALFGLGFGLTVTPRSTAAVEALGRRAFGMASASVVVARMGGMAVGLAVLTSFGSRRIEALSVVLTNAAARDAVLPPDLQGRPLEDGLVVAALERWAAGEAATILAGLFLVAAIVSAVAIIPTLLMTDRTRATRRATISPEEALSGSDADEGSQPAAAF